MIMDKKAMLKAFFSYKIYAWITVLLLVIITGIYGYGYFSGKATTKDGNLQQASSMVTKLEKTQEHVFLNVGIQDIATDKKDIKILKQSIPGTEKKIILILNYELKIGIKSPVNIKKTGEKSYQIQLPPYEVIGFGLNESFNTYDESGQLASFATKEPDKLKIVTKTRKDKKKHQKYINQFKDLINQSAEDHYQNLFKSIDEDFDIEVIFPN